MKEFITVVLNKKVEGLRKRESATHQFEDENFNKKSSSKITVAEFWNDYYSRKHVAHSFYETDFFISITFEN